MSIITNLTDKQIDDLTKDLKGLNQRMERGDMYLNEVK